MADFLTANRSAGRYLLTMAQGMSSLGAITIAANFEQFYQAGFAALWWAQMLAPLALILALSGFVIYRYRETRAMTMAQFFEMRYSRRFRIFSGFLAFSSGILNYGIFPIVTARFLVYFAGLPAEFALFGWTLPTVVPIMAVLLTISVTMTTMGGQISVMITDFLQGQFVSVTVLIILAVLFYHMSWQDVLEGLRAAPPGQSRINPFKQEDVSDFNVWFFMILAFSQVYGYKAWQGSQGYNAAAKNPHEAKMAGILAEFRGMIATLLMLLIPVFIFAYLHLPQFAGESGVVEGILSGIDDSQIRRQMLVPTALGTILPTGVMGLFAAVIIAAAISTDTTYLHSWSSIFIQDVVLPFRKTRLSQKAHLWLLRGAIIGVALFAFTWSLIFPLKEFIMMYFQITGAIFTGGAGAVILGGLYWPRGTAGGAWAAMITGSSLAVTGILIRSVFWPTMLPHMVEWFPDRGFSENFPFNGIQMAFFAALSAIAAYVVVSLLSKTPPANMDKLLHRGRYAVGQEHPKGEPHLVQPSHPLQFGRPRSWWERLGMGPEFTRGDKAIYLIKVAWVTFFVTVFAIGTTICLFSPFADSTWEKWWGFQVGLTLVAGSITVVWFLWMGFRDLFEMVRTLRSVDRNPDDDGTVEPDEHAQPLRNRLDAIKAKRS